MIRKTSNLAILFLLAATVAGCGLFNSPQSTSTTFLVRIENVSTPTTLTTSEGTSVALPLAPGVFAIHTISGAIFQNGKPDTGLGLERLAEDGNPTELAASLATQIGVLSAGIFNTPMGAGSPGPLLSGESYEFQFSANDGDRLSFATMFVQSNDLFYAPLESGIFLFDAQGNPIQGEITSQIFLWDAGTEVNQEPGVGTDQAPRQSGPNFGPNENGLVEVVSDGYLYPSIDDVIKVTITHIH